ncbi:ECF RNA polymerase sigma factor SigM [Gimesia panareensis]|uniref:ECF RNA polymerase sigma factor SigM n=1 Tax=Gimesia panareensis TaxID=2527978 RepID=A0A518FN14_9PLAN|nr:sigma-70 family RNA polymerase sigma factor [Gimesia panareensis]QDV17744.1 ECF RNA polymerase sigma factor SigM [Gimesia panareensis]
MLVISVNAKCIEKWWDDTAPILLDKLKTKFQTLTSQDIEDALQETVMIALIRTRQNENYFKAPHSFSSWCEKVSVNRCLDLIRKSKRKSEAHLVQGFRYHNTLPINEAQNFEHDELVKEVVDSINKLPVTSRKVVKLYLDGWSIKEIGKLIGATPRQVYYLKNSGIKRISEAIK